MHEERPAIPPQPKSAASMRRGAVAALGAFVLLSTALHFALGPEVTKLSPHWAAADDTDQVVAVVTLSRKEESQPVARPTPTPTPSPIPLPRTRRDLTLLKYHELGVDTRMHSIHPPARRHTIILDRAPDLTPHEDAKDAKVVAAVPEPTPQTSQAQGAAKVDTGGRQDQLNGSLQWGDDNPVRLIKAAPLGVDDRATGIARVEVDVDPDGSVIGVRLVQSSGDASVDQAALAAARASTYAPATTNGMPVHGSCVIEFPPPGQQT